MSNFPSAVQLVRRSLDTVLAKDMKGWSLLCADDAVAEFPFAPQGSPSRLEVREGLCEYLRNDPSVINVRSIPHLRIYATDDPNVAIAEWSASGEVLTNGNACEMSYATFVAFGHHTFCLDVSAARAEGPVVVYDTSEGSIEPYADDFPAFYERFLQEQLGDGGAAGAS